MARSQIYPGADQSRRYEKRYPGVTQSTVSKLVLHSTETSQAWGCPGYGGGAAAPTLTVCPWTKRVWQHFPATVSARALLNPDSTNVSENRDNVAQIEIVGYSDAKIAAKWGSSLRELPESGYDFLAEVVAWFVTEWDVPARVPDRPWLTYPSSYGKSSARMTGAEYDRYTGILGHLHVSGNLHGDPTLDIDLLMRKVKAITKGGTASLTATSKSAVKDFQRAIGVSADGVWGPATEKQAQAVRAYLAMKSAGARKPTTRERAIAWRVVRGRPREVTKKIQQALDVGADGLWGKATDEAWLTLRRHRYPSAWGYTGSKSS